MLFPSFKKTTQITKQFFLSYKKKLNVFSNYYFATVNTDQQLIILSFLGTAWTVVYSLMLKLMASLQSWPGDKARALLNQSLHCSSSQLHIAVTNSRNLSCAWCSRYAVINNSLFTLYMTLLCLKQWLFSNDAQALVIQVIYDDNNSGFVIRKIKVSYLSKHGA